MQNVIPDSTLAGTSAQDVALRSLAGRLDTCTTEVDRLLQAGQAVMQRTQSVTPRVSDIVREAGLSNQAFYRYFHGRDDLLLAILRAGRRSLVDYVTHLMAKEAGGTGKVRRWIEGILAQAADPGAAEATSPFVRNSLDLAGRFPDEVRLADAELRGLLVPVLLDARESGIWPAAEPERDSQALYQLSMGTMQTWVLGGFHPGPGDVAHVVAFGLAGLGRQRRATPAPAQAIQPGPER